MFNDNESKRVRYSRLAAQLKNERSSFEADWTESNNWILSRRARFFTSDTNKGGRRNQRIIDSTGTLAVRTLRAGMVSGITSPSRDWKKLTVDDPDLAEFGSVKRWLSIVNDRMSNSFLRSNFYKVMPNIYGDASVFATSGMFVEEDFSGGVSHFTSLPVGSYWIANDDKMKVRVMMREFPMTVRQIVSKFGVKPGTRNIDWKNISEYVKLLWELGEYEAWIDVAHMVHENTEYDENKFADKKFVSCYYELGSSNMQTGVYLTRKDEDVYLRESGYDYFPGLFLRWGVTGGDVYGTDCPGFDAIGDIKQLQHGEKKAAKAIDKGVDPAMVGPSALRNQKASILPGDITYTDEREGMKGFRQAHEVNLDLNHLEMKQAQIRQRIQKAFYEDLFLMLSESDRREITAREIDERHEEKLQALGPVLEQTNELLDELIDIQFDFMLRQGEIPPPPPELEGMDLKVEYVSIMAQAQKLAGVANLERFAGTAANIAQLTGSVPKKFNIDQFIDVYGDRLSVDPTIIRTDEEVEAMNQAEQQAMQQQQAVENIERAAGAANKLAGAKLEEDSALKRLVGK